MKVFLHGLMVENMKEVGSIIKWMDLVHKLGPMAVHTKDHSKMGLDMVMGPKGGLMEKCMKASGPKINRMALDK